VVVVGATVVVVGGTVVVLVVVVVGATVVVEVVVVGGGGVVVVVVVVVLGVHVYPPSAFRSAQILSRVDGGTVWPRATEVPATATSTNTTRRYKPRFIPSDYCGTP
jgi:hypothetical protein